MNTQTQLPGMDSGTGSPRPAVDGVDSSPPRVELPERDQMLLESYCLEDLVGPDDPVRIIWEIVKQWNLSRFYAAYRARGSQPGRAALDPRVLIAVWLYGATRNVSSGRELERRCQREAGF